MKFCEKQWHRTNIIFLKRLFSLEVWIVQIAYTLSTSVKRENWWQLSSIVAIEWSVKFIIAYISTSLDRLSVNSVNNWCFNINSSNHKRVSINRIILQIIKQISYEKFLRLFQVLKQRGTYDRGHHMPHWYATNLWQVLKKVWHDATDISVQIVLRYDF